MSEPVTPLWRGNATAKSAVRLCWSVFVLVIINVFVLTVSSSPRAATSELVEAEPHSIGWNETSSGCNFWLFPPPATPAQSVIVTWGPPPTWTGECVDGKADGKGVLDVAEGTAKMKYEGSMSEGKMNGRGTWTLSNGDVLSGKFHDGKLVGKFAYSSVDGMHFEGEQKDGIPEGDGTASWISGSHYEGHWHLGKPSGQGVMHYATKGSPMYEGMFDDGKRSGHGVITYDNDLSIEGEWDNDTLNGLGRGTDKDGNRFEGTFADGLLNGHGVMISRNGTWYEGDWKDGMPDGQGTLLRAGQSVYTGTWARGCYLDDSRPTSFAVSKTACPATGQVTR